MHLMAIAPVFSVVVPVYNEGVVLRNLEQRLSRVLESLGKPYEVIFVDDGSKDESPAVLRQLVQSRSAYRLILFSKNFGHQAAVTAGVDAAAGDAVVVIDADLQDPPELIPQLAARWQEGYDVVYAVRMARKGESLFKRTTASIFYRGLRLLTTLELPLDTGDFRLMSRQAATALTGLRERHRFIRGMVAWLGFRQTGVPYVREPRAGGETKYSIRKMVALAADAIFSFSAFPLQLASYFGLISAAISFGALVYVLYIRIFTAAAITGWASVMAALAFIGSIQLLTLGIIGSYIARIYDEVRQRPIYIIASRYGFAEEGSDDSQTSSGRARGV
jgi:dolichol-phosphate mannosyltransferase